MLDKRRWLVLPLVVMVMGVLSCADSEIDDGDAPDVQLEVVALDNPAITGTLEAAGCAFVVEEWAATLAAVPKSSLAITSPFNDIVVVDVVVSYGFLDATIVVPDRVIGLGDVTVPANGTNSVTFAPISFDDLLSNPAIEGSSANLTMTFRAVTVEGAQIFDTVYRQLTVETCTGGDE